MFPFLKFWQISGKRCQKLSITFAQFYVYLKSIPNKNEIEKLFVQICRNLSLSDIYVYVRFNFPCSAKKLILQIIKG